MKDFDAYSPVGKLALTMFAVFVKFEGSGKLINSSGHIQYDPRRRAIKAFCKIMEREADATSRAIWRAPGHCNTLKQLFGSVVVQG